MLDKQHSPLGKHVNSKSTKANHQIMPLRCVHYRNLAKLAQSNTGSVTHSTTVLWFPVSL